jgi:hypothetical protein
MIRIDLPQMFLRKGRAGAIAQQSLPTLAVASSRACASGGEARLLKTQALGIFAEKHTIEHDEVKMQMGVDQCAETVDEDDGADVRLAIHLRKALPQVIQEIGLAMQPPAQPTPTRTTASFRLDGYEVADHCVDLGIAHGLAPQGHFARTMPFDLALDNGNGLFLGENTFVVCTQSREVWGSVSQVLRKYPFTLPVSAMADCTFVHIVLLGIRKSHAWSSDRNRCNRNNQFN